MNEEHETEMLEEYDFSGGVRGKYVNRFAEGANVVVLDPDVARVFSDSESLPPNRSIRHGERLPESFSVNQKRHIRNYIHDST